MSRLLRRGVPAIALFSIFTLLPTAAWAYCRTITSPIPADFDQTSGCFTPAGAIPLWWSGACVGFSVQENASKQISVADARSHAVTAFGRWSGASCSPSGKPSVQVIDEGPVACDQVLYSQIGPNQHAIIFRDTSWPYSDPYNTLALTTVTFDTDTGEIYDADMEINTAETTLVIDTPPAANQYDFDSIIPHEAGHFLGMAHSPLDTAVMFAHYKAGSSTLSADDITGICDIYTPGGARNTEQDAGTSIVAVSVPESTTCDPTPRHGFGSACGPAGAPAQTTTTHSCAISSVPGGGSGGTDARLGLAGVALAVLIARRRRAARIPHMKRVRAVALASLLAVGGGAVGQLLSEHEARASISIAVLFDELVRDSTAAAIVTPMEQRAVWENGRIITYTHVHTDRPVAGTVEDEPWIRTMGGTLGRIGQLVDGEPVLTTGRQGLLFLRPLAEEGAGVYEVTARAQGQFPLVVDEQKAPRFRASSAVGGLVATPQKRVAEISQMRTSAGLVAGAPLATDVLHKRAVEEGVRDVAAAWVRIHGAK